MQSFSEFKPHLEGENKEKRPGKAHEKRFDVITVLIKWLLCIQQPIIDSLEAVFSSTNVVIGFRIDGAGEFSVNRSCNKKLLNISQKLPKK